MGGDRISSLESYGWALEKECCFPGVLCDVMRLSIACVRAMAMSCLTLIYNFSSLGIEYPGLKKPAVSTTNGYYYYFIIQTQQSPAIILKVLQLHSSL